MDISVCEPHYVNFVSVNLLHSPCVWLFDMILAVILGIEFLRKFDIVSWGEQGRIKLKEDNDDLIHSRSISDSIHYPVSISRNVTIPPRLVASIVTLTNLLEPGTKIMYKMITADDPSDLGGDAIAYPLCYATMVGGDRSFPWL